MAEWINVDIKRRVTDVPFTSLKKILARVCGGVRAGRVRRRVCGESKYAVQVEHYPKKGNK